MNEVSIITELVLQEIFRGKIVWDSFSTVSFSFADSGILRLWADELRQRLIMTVEIGWVPQEEIYLSMILMLNDKLLASHGLTYGLDAKSNILSLYRIFLLDEISSKLRHGLKSAFFLFNTWQPAIKKYKSSQNYLHKDTESRDLENQIIKHYLA